MLIAVSGLCATKVCPTNKICEVKGGQPVCVCLDVRQCPASLQPVCGSDGQTYISVCHLVAHACKEGLGTNVTKLGQCGKKHYILTINILLTSLFSLKRRK